ncbi:MAG: Blue-light-activated protein [Syntrophaceae bacterium PtaU1.Bin231]|nr:MAG: Blue-light-activated protein [Syntrophaceae bacterium PtaU1.Bin231]
MAAAPAAGPGLRERLIGLLLILGAACSLVAGWIVWSLFRTRETLRQQLQRQRQLAVELEGERLRARESEARYRSVIENIQDVFYRSDSEGNLIMASPSFVGLLGFDSFDDCLGKPVADTFYADPSQRTALLAEIQEKGSIQNYEVVLKKTDGTPVIVETNSHIYFDETGRAAGIEGTFRDISLRKQAQEALRKSEKLYASLVDTIPDIIIRTNLAGDMLFVNDRALKISGYEQAEVEGRSIYGFVAPEDRDRLRRNISQLLESGIGPQEYRIIYKDGSLVPFEVNGDVLRSGDGEPYGFAFVCRDISERKRADEALRQSEERYRTILEEIEDGYQEVDLKGNFTFLNESFAKILGYRGSEVIGTNFRQYAADEANAKKIWRLYNRMYRTGVPLKKQEWDVVTKQGVRRTLEFFASVIRDAQGRPVGFRGIGRDITDRKHAEEQYRMVADGSQAGIYIVQDGKICYANPHIFVYSGYPAEELIGARILDFVHPDDRAGVKEKALTMLRGEIESPYEYRIIDREKNVKWLLERVTSISYRGRQAVLGSNMDITEHRRAEEMSRLSEEKFTSIFMTAPECIAITRMSDGLILDVNLGFEEMTGWQRGEAIGRTSLDINFWGESAERDRMTVDLRGGRDILNREFQFRRKDGVLRTGIYSSRPIRIAGELCLIFVLQDITDRRKLEEDHRKLEQQLIQAQKMEAVGTLAGGIAHDFNNILSGIMGYTELHLKDVQDRPKVHQGMEQVLKAAHRAKDLVKQILTFSRKTEQEKTAVAVGPIVREVVKFLRASLPTMVEIKETIAAPADTILANPSQIHQVLMNLCANAGHAMRETGGVLEIGLKEVAAGGDEILPFPSLTSVRCLELTVRDTGHGIAPENLARIFDPYFTTKEKGEGTGLGLAVVHGIVKDHGGEITVESGKGLGTVFRIYLPLIDRQGDDGTAADEAVMKGKGERILFIDDERMVIELSREILEGLGYRIVTETDPVKAVEVFKAASNAFDLVITDKTMPHMTGFDVIRQIRAVRADIPVVLCSGFQAKDDLEKLNTLGVGELIAKPIRMKALAKTIRDVLDANKPEQRGM